MPKYNYLCKDCGVESEQLLKIKNRTMPCDEPCLTCGKTSVGLVIKAVGTVSGVQEPSSAPKDFRNLMKEISHKAGPRSEMDT